MISHSGPVVEEFAAAKINLALHVTGRRDDGYHLLDSIVAFADVGDVLRLGRSSTTALTVSGPFGQSLQGEVENLVLAAARSWAGQYGASDQGAEIELIKALPVASGIGGGSADAAAALRGLNRLWHVEPPADGMNSLALGLGADVPVCLQGCSCRMSGIGERIAAIGQMPEFAAILVNPAVPVATAQVFSRIGLKPGGKGNGALDAVPASSDAGDWLTWLKDQRNDMQAAAIELAPVIGECLAAIAGSEGCQLARMSGSGATCFGLFATPAQAKAAAAELSAAQPQWWVADTTIG